MNTKEKNSEERQFFIALGHDIRRQILRLIGSGETIGFSGIKKETQVSTGTIYHHLEVLADFVSQNQKKKYQLTDIGKKAYLLLTRDQSSHLPPERVLPPKIRDFLFLTSFSNFLIDSSKWGKSFTLGVVSVIGLICALFDISAYFIPSRIILRFH